jgi:hypothetical protein
MESAVRIVEMSGIASDVSILKAIDFSPGTL